MFGSFHPLADETKNEHLPKPFFKVIRKSLYPASVINPSTVFSTFDLDKLGKIQPHHWKEHIKIIEFESDNYVLRERRYNVCKFSQLWVASPADILSGSSRNHSSP